MAQINKPGEHFNTLIWTGNGNATRSYTGVGFQPDLIWVKNRSATLNHGWIDSIRSTNKRIQSSTSGAEIVNPSSGYLSSFDSDGFSVQAGTSSTANFNTNSENYVTWNWLAAGTAPSKTYTVKVVSDSGNKYRFDDFGTSAVTLDLEEGSTYVFDQSDSSNSGHPLRFSTTSDGTHNSGSEYTTGVTSTGTPGSAGAKTTIVVAASAPTLYYYCSVHSGMGGQANTNSTAGASNFDGSIQTTVKANPQAGFSIVSYSGSGSNGTIGHGLNAPPSLIITKSRNTANIDWIIYSPEIDDGKILILNGTNAQFTGAGGKYGTVGSSTYGVVEQSNFGNLNASGSTYIAYCFAPVEGYSAFGSYTGNGNADGPFVFTGFRPRWIMFKNTTSAIGWYILDTQRDEHNVSNTFLFANTNGAEGNASTSLVDILSNGFKLRGTGDTVNASGANYIYAAFASSPLQYARAR